jgi:leucyl/phenylalanyl-tRNA---protein transferase
LNIRLQGITFYCKFASELGKYTQKIMFWLNPKELSFPDPRQGDDEGLIALGGDLSPQRLLFAYSIGLFPWFNDDEPILWWSPNPRFVLYPKDLVVAKSMRPYFNQQKFRVTFDTCFDRIIKECGEKRRKDTQEVGTWITEDIIAAYTYLHLLGYAHSVEVWEGETLVGGLYGLSLGKVFYGESMFAHQPNASKFGFITLVKKLEAKGFHLIDCQQKTQHLMSLGAIGISRDVFMEQIETWVREETQIGSWTEWLNN